MASAMSWIKRKVPQSIWRWRWVVPAATAVKLIYEFFAWMGWWSVILALPSALASALLAMATPLGLFTLILIGTVIWLLLALGRLAWLHAAAYQTTPKVRHAPSAAIGDFVLPHDVDARSAILYAANGSWAKRPHDPPANLETAAELERTYRALTRFYELAGMEDGLRVWGRIRMSRPLKLIEHAHWQDWQIEIGQVFADPNVEPLRTVPRDRLPERGAPYYDLHLNKSEVERAWRHRMVSLHDAAQRCFEETGLFGREQIGGKTRLYQFVVHLIVEGNRRPHLLRIWGMQLPSSKMARVPAERLVLKNLRNSGSEIWADFGFIEEREWIELSVLEDELSAFIGRLKKGETAGQESSADEDLDKYRA
jgi:hypothetical protein